MVLRGPVGGAHGGKVGLGVLRLNHLTLRSFACLVFFNYSQIATVRVDPPMAPQGAAARSADAHSAGRLPLPVCCTVSCR